MSKAGAIPLIPLCRFPVWTFRFAATAFGRIHGVKNMARFRTLVGLGLASTMMMTAPVFASTTTAKPATQQTAAPKGATAKRATPARSGAHAAKAAHGSDKKAA